jgi:hypothetical protein
VVPYDAIPQAVKDAQCELANEALSGSLAPASERGGRIASENVAGVSVSYFADAPTGRTFPKVDMMLRRLTGGSTSLMGEAILG